MLANVKLAASELITKC